MIRTDVYLKNRFHNLKGKDGGKTDGRKRILSSVPSPHPQTHASVCMRERQRELYCVKDKPLDKRSRRAHTHTHAVALHLKDFF